MRGRAAAEERARAGGGTARALERAGLVLTAGLLVWFAARGVGKALRPGGNDFTIYYEAARAALAGRDPLQVPEFLYLPVFALALAPLALLPLGAAAAAWQALNLLCVAAIARDVRALSCAGVARVEHGPAARAAPAWLLWLPTLCALRLYDSCLGYGQANLVVLALVLRSARAFVAGREGAAGSWAAGAAALKLLPALLGLHFLCRRSWRALGAALAVGAALVVLLPAARFGWHAHLAQLGEWWGSVVAPYARGGEALVAERGYVPGQSLTAVAYRLLTATPATSAADPDVTAHVLDLSPRVVAWVVRGLSAALLLGLAALLVRGRRDARPGARAREQALVLLAALVVGPLVHKAHMVWVVLPYGLLLQHLLGYGERPRRRALVWTLFAGSVVCVAGSTPALGGRALSTGLLSHNVVFLGVALAGAATLALHLGLTAGDGRSGADPERARGADR